MLQNPSIEKVIQNVATFLLLTLISTAALAQGSDGEARMQELVEQAATAFSENRFADSATLFEQANEAQPNPTLLKNAMVAWYKGKRCDEAVHAAANFYREAQKSGELEAKDQSEIQTVISCSLNLAEQRIDEGKFSDAEDLLFTATSAGPSTEQTDRIAKLRDSLRTRRDSEAPTTGTTPKIDQKAEEPSGSSGLAIAGWSITGVGAAGLVGSAVYALTAASAQRDAVSTCTSDFESQGSPITDSRGPTTAFQTCVEQEYGEDNARYATIADDVNGARRNSVIFYSVSGAVTAAGIGILVYHYLLSTPEEAAPSVMVTPMLGTDTAGAQLIWRF